MAEDKRISVILKAPAVKKGWLKKQGRGGMIKNWKTRYFVISQGTLNYYQDKINEFPYGENLKASDYLLYFDFNATIELLPQGDLYLGNTEIIEENKNYNDRQIYIVNYNGERNILIEAESVEEAQEWMESIREHTAYANRVARESTIISDRRTSQNMSAHQAPSAEESSRRQSSAMSSPASTSPMVTSCPPKTASAMKPRSKSIESDDSDEDSLSK